MRSRLSMIASRLMIGAFAMIMITGARCGNPPQQAFQGNESGNVPDTESTQLVQLINQNRASRKMNLLVMDPTMQKVAKQYSRELAEDDRWSYSFVINGQDADTRMRLAELTYTESGHTGGLDFNSAETMVNALIVNNSFVVNDGKYNRIGVGVSGNGSRIYWTIFVTN